MKVIVILISSYLIGSILTGEIVAHFKKVDLRSLGSGNVGATNVFRTLGTFYGIIVLLGDALKGIVAVLLGTLIGKFYNFDYSILTGVLAIVGHNWSIFARFRGGKGIATSMGVAIALTPLILFVALPVWGVTFGIFGYVSLASILAAVAYPISVYLFYPNDPYKLVFTIIIACLAIYRHKANLKRLIQGEEHRILYQNKRSATKK
jgi:acyl phosphate:glycerol-3-phosphate acyltransferase